MKILMVSGINARLYLRLCEIFIFLFFSIDNINEKMNKNITSPVAIP